MLKRTLPILTLLVLLMPLEASSQIIKQKIIDDGGSGPFKAIAVKDQGLPDFVIYRPADLRQTHTSEGTVPIVVFANGGCSDTSIGYERMLNEVASHGYVVVAIGEMQDKRGDRPEGYTESSELKRGLDWMVARSTDKDSEYYQNVDPARVAAAGHSCGGAQVLANAADPRLQTCLILNAGMGEMQMAGASSESLPNLHCPVLYVTGGPSDVAYKNAQLDYSRIHNVPVVLADHPASGHTGTYDQQYGGDYSRIVLAWLDWQLKGKTENESIFVKGNLESYPGWSVKNKNFSGERCYFESLWIKNGERNIYGVISKPRYSGSRQPVAIISHGFNGTHHYGRTYFETLNSLGYQVYVFDFPCGSIFSSSDSNTMNMSILDEKSDLRAIVRHFQQQPDVDPKNIVLIGESQGGFVTALTSAEIPKEISAVVLVFPALCIPANWQERYPKVSDIPDTTRLWNVPLGRRFFLELRDINVFKTIRKYKGPVLIVQGDKDAVVLMEDSKRAVKTYKNARLHVIPGAGHGFNPEEQAQSLQQIKAFLEENNKSIRQ